MADMMVAVLRTHPGMPEALGGAVAGKGQSEAGSGLDFTAVLEAARGGEEPQGATASSAANGPQTAETTTTATEAETAILAIPVLPGEIQPLAPVALNGPQITGFMPGVGGEVGMDSVTLSQKAEHEVPATEESGVEDEEEADSGETSELAGQLLVDPGNAGLIPDGALVQALVTGGLNPGIGVGNGNQTSEIAITSEASGYITATDDVSQGIRTVGIKPGNANLQGMEMQFGEEQLPQNPGSFTAPVTEGAVAKANGSTVSNPADLQTKVANPGLKTGLNGYEVSYPARLSILPPATLKGRKGDSQPFGDPAVEVGGIVGSMTMGETVKSNAVAESGLEAGVVPALKFEQSFSGLEGGQLDLGSAGPGKVDLKNAIWGAGQLHSESQGQPFVAVTDTQTDFSEIVQNWEGMLKTGVRSEGADSASQQISFDTKPFEIKGAETEAVDNLSNGPGSNVVIPQPVVKLEHAGETSSKVSPHSAPEPNELFSQIVEQSKLMVHQGQSEMEMSLKPEHLGKLKLKVALENQIVTASFVAESEQVKQIIETNLVNLRKTLQDNGIQVENLQVSVGQQQQSGTFNSNHSQSNGQASFHSRSFPGETDRMDYESEPTVTSRTSTSRVDLIA